MSLKNILMVHLYDNIYTDLMFFLKIPKRSTNKKV